MNAPESRLATAAVRTDREWLEPQWMPYCANRAFKADPHLFVAGEGAWLTTSDGRRLFDQDWKYIALLTGFRYSNQ